MSRDFVTLVLKTNSAAEDDADRFPEQLSIS